MVTERQATCIAALATAGDMPIGDVFRVAQATSEYMERGARPAVALLGQGPGFFLIALSCGHPVPCRWPVAAGTILICPECS